MTGDQDILLAVNDEGQFVLRYRRESMFDQINVKSVQYTESLSRINIGQDAAAEMLGQYGWHCARNDEAGREHLAAQLSNEGWTCAPPGRDSMRQLLDRYFDPIAAMGGEGPEFLRYEMARRGFAPSKVDVPNDRPERA